MVAAIRGGLPAEPPEPRTLQEEEEEEEEGEELPHLGRESETDTPEGMSRPSGPNRRQQTTQTGRRNNQTQGDSSDIPIQILLRLLSS